MKTEISDLFHQHNSWSHKSLLSLAAVRDSVFEQFEHSPYSLDLNTYDCWKIVCSLTRKTLNCIAVMMISYLVIFFWSTRWKFLHHWDPSTVTPMCKCMYRKVRTMLKINVAMSVLVSLWPFQLILAIYETYINFDICTACSESFLFMEIAFLVPNFHICFYQKLCLFSSGITVEFVVLQLRKFGAYFFNFWCHFAVITFRWLSIS